jgi:spore germination cell wall hydrolase CwlJ-like protein
MKVKTAIALALNVTILATMGYTAYSATDNQDIMANYDYGRSIDVHPEPIVSPTSLYLARLDTEEVNCLALNVYFEARNQSINGQRAVAWVTMNRVESERYPDSICEVVWQDRQFSWTHDGKSDTPGGNVIEDAAWEIAQQIAVQVLVNNFESRRDPVRGATHYHADYVDPYWAEHYAEITTVDNHVFYK